MRYILGVLLVFALLIQSGPQAASQSSMWVGNGFYSPKDFLEMSQSDKELYVAAQINGMLVATLWGASEDKVKKVNTCVGNMKGDTEQIAAIVTKYIKDNPQEWHYPLNMTMVSAMIGACPFMGGEKTKARQ